MENEEFSLEETPPPTSGVNGGSGGPILMAGAATTALALLGVYLLEQVGWSVMSWHDAYVLPTGAFLVGLAASSGYGVASWLTGTKIRGRLLFLVIVLLGGGYFLAKYVEFRSLFPMGAHLHDGTPIGSWRYFDVATRAFSFEDETTHQPGTPLGLLGYGVRALEIVGFVGGGLLTPWSLRHKPYCEACQRYKRSRVIAWIAASIPVKRISKRDVEELTAYQANVAAAAKRGEDALSAIFRAARTGDGAEVPGLLAAQGGKEVARLPARISVTLIHCQRCLAGELTGMLVVREGRGTRRKPIGAQPLPAGLVGQLAA
ncbi:MAG: hypothetical protein ACYCWW_16685 [Deltaproteobacteria bacterium]